MNSDVQTTLAHADGRYFNWKVTRFDPEEFGSFTWLVDVDPTQSLCAADRLTSCVYAVQVANISTLRCLRSDMGIGAETLHVVLQLDGSYVPPTWPVRFELTGYDPAQPPTFVNLGVGTPSTSFGADGVFVVEIHDTRDYEFEITP